MEVLYRKRDGARIATDVETVGRRLDHLAERGGGAVTPAAVVEDATPIGSDLHPEFEWDDREAARLQREERARALMRSYVRVYLKDNGEESKPLIPLIHIRDDEGSAYRRIEDVDSNDAWREQMLADAQRQLDGLTLRLAMLTEAREVLLDIEAARAKVAKLLAARARRAAKVKPAARAGRRRRAGRKAAAAGV